MPSLEEIQLLEGHEDRVWQLAWSPNGKQLASCGGDATVRIWQLNEKTQKYESVDVLQGQHQRTIRSIAWSPSGKTLACGSFDSTTSIWDINDEGEFECTTTLEGHENEVKSVAWDHTGKFLATCSRDKTVWIWESLGDGEFDCVSVLNGHTQDVKMVRWHPSKEHLFSTSYDNTIRVWTEDVDDWYCSDIMRAHHSTVWSIAFNDKGTHLVSSSDDQSLRFWKYYDKNTSQMKDDKEFEWRNVLTLENVHKRPIYFVDWSPFDNLIASCSGDDSIKIFGPEGGDDIINGDEPKFVERCSVNNAHSTEVNCVTWNTKFPHLLASASDDSTIKIWKYNKN